MINEQQTFELFGYFSASVDRNKKVVVVCGSCGESRIITKAAAIQSKVCARCQRSEQAKKMANTDRVGRKHSEETKKKIGASNKVSQKKGEESPSFGKKRSEGHKESIRAANRDRVWSQESRDKISTASKGRKHSLETRQKMSEARLLQPTRIGHKASHGKGAYYVDSCGENIWMRSSWEVRTGVYLDSKGIPWKYEPQAFPIQYEINGRVKQGTYRPDFEISLPGGIEYWEIKGWWRDDARIKYEAFVEQYSNLVVKLMNKEELFRLGVFDKNH